MERGKEPPLLPMARVVDEDGREVCRGWYARLRRSTYCVKGEEPEDNVMECVLMDELTDWGMPNRHVIKEVTPPHRIEAVESTARLCGRFEEKLRVEAWRCSACGATVMRGGSMLPNYCSNCGRKVEEWSR